MVEKVSWWTIVVDELPICNEQSSRITLEESSNEEDAMMDDFPFLRGNPFTATLWFGFEGFHMTVNGRHETSFPYREVKNEYANLKLLCFETFKHI